MLSRSHSRLPTCLRSLRLALGGHGGGAVLLLHHAGAPDALDDLQEHGGPVAQGLREDLQQHALHMRKCSTQGMAV